MTKIAKKENTIFFEPRHIVYYDHDHNPSS